jgi:hypothetical protein
MLRSKLPEIRHSKNLDSASSDCQARVCGSTTRSLACRTGSVNQNPFQLVARVQLAVYDASANRSNSDQ